MVSDKQNNSKKRKRFHYDKYRAGDIFEVEEVVGFKLQNSELMIYVKWENFSDSDNTWETYENLVQCSVFQDYVNQKFISLERDIYAHVATIKLRLNDRIREAMDERKFITMLDVQPFDPFEFKVMQVFYHLVSPDEVYTKRLEELVFKNYFFKRDQRQRELNDEFLKMISEKEDFKVTIENDEDFSDPPDVQYITKNFLTDDIYEIDQADGVQGCSCDVCSKDSNCCPQLVKKRFSYKLDKNRKPALRFKQPKTIIECGEMCKCSKDCVNRLTQRKKEVPLCLFKTKDRGWGVKAVTPIEEGTLLLEYVGELIGQTEADARQETAYLFDLNVDRRSDRKFYTIDAFKYGNLSRFVNHSCNPNAIIWFVNNCHQDPKNQKLFFFADKFIPKDQEITIDYTGGDGGHSSEPIPCYCGAKKCRKIIY